MQNANVNNPITSLTDNAVIHLPYTPVPTPMAEEEAVTGSYRTAALSEGKIDGRVSKQWLNRPDDEKFLNLSDLYQHVNLRAQRCVQDIVDPSQIRVKAQGDELALLPYGEEGSDYAMTHWAFGQLCSLTKCPAEYLRRLPETLAGINLQHGLMNYDGAGMQLFSYEHENGGKELRATTGMGYGRIYDKDVVAQVMRIAGNGTGDTRWKVPGMIDWTSNNGVTVAYNPFVEIDKENTTLYASDRDVYLFLVDDTHPIEVGKLPNGEPDLMFRGFIVWNSETGSKSFGMTTMLLRGVCQNRNLWGVGETRELRIRHSRMAPDRFAYQAAPVLERFANASTAGIVSKVTEAKGTIVAADKEEGIAFLTGKAALSKPLAERVLETVLREEQAPARSVWDMVQGMTAVARSVKHQDARLDMEMKAGKLMDKIAA